jgi:formate hydrogenlyase subunit 3/multisubunit Na+/H+ antiporter MnhD subunit
MSAPLIWIIFPAALAFVLLALQRRKILVFILGTSAAFLLAVFAWVAPIGEPVTLGPITLELSSALTFLGRRVVLEANDRYTLILIYLGLAFWFAGTPAVNLSRLFIPLGLAIAALLTSALAVEPFLFAALIIEMMVLVSVPLLTPVGALPGRGITRYLTFQTLGFPLILFTGWMMDAIETGQATPEMSLLSGLLLALGFGFLLGVFPFHSWIPLLSYETHPYAIAFIFYELPVAITLLMLGFLDQFAWLRENPDVYSLLAIVGALMILIGGLWAAFQRHLGRLFGYAVMVEIGISLVAISVGLGPDGSGSALGLYFVSILPRGLSFGLWALSLTILARGLRQNGDPGSLLTSTELGYNKTEGLGRLYPLAAFSLLLAQFSIAGIPLLAGFPVRVALLEGAARNSVAIALVILLGSVGLTIGAVRSMAVLITGAEDNPWQSLETPAERAYLVIGCIAILIIGLFPQWFAPVLSQMATSFLELGP